jgi:hypothetical protein
MFLLLTFKQKKMISDVFHVSGAPGAGKTYLSTQLKALGVQVIETDSLLTHTKGTPGGDLVALENDPLRFTPELYESTWRRVFREQIFEALDSLSLPPTAAGGRRIAVCLVGILTHFGDDGWAPVYVGDIVSPGHRFYLDVPGEVIVQRYYARLCDIPARDEYWSKLWQGAYSVPSSAQLRANYDHDRKWHLENGYVALDAQGIVDAIEHRMALSSLQTHH